MKKIFFALIFVSVLISSGLISGCSTNNFNIDSNLKVIKEKTFSVSSNKLLLLETDAGDLIINSWGKDEAHIKISGNKKAENEFSFVFNNANGVLKILAEGSGISSIWKSGIKLKFEITLPKSFNINASTKGGDMEITNISGISELYTSGGNISAKNINGNFKAKTSGGDIKVIDFKGNLNLQTSGGDITLRGKNGKINASTSGGNIIAEYNGMNLGILLSTSGGNIKLKVDNNFSAAARLSSSAGEVFCNLPLNNVENRSHSKLKADINSGGAELILKTSGGDIYLGN